jgi:UDP-glucose 4-epimerase
MATPRLIMVCGGAGFIGSHLVDRLLAEGHEVDVVDDLSTGSLTNLNESRSGSGRFKFQNISVASAEFSELVSLRRPSVIVNLASFAPSHMHLAGASSSLAATIAVLEAARRGAVSKVVTAIPAHLLYGEVATRDLPIKEGHINDARTTEEVLGRAAADMHHVYRDRHGVEFTVLAMSNVYGKRQRTEDGVVASFLDALSQGKAPIIHGSGKQIRDFVFIDDTVDAMSRSLERAGGLVINVGTGVSTSINDLWSVMGGVAAPAPRSAAERPHDIARLSLSPVRARIQLGWSPFTTLEQGLASLR